MPNSKQNFWQALPRPIIALAPMVDVTDSAFRQLAKQWGADVVYSEMISADALMHNSPKTKGMLAHDGSEYPFVVQLMGKDPAVLAGAAKMAAAAGADGIDINFGCPANKVAKNMCGVMLMRDLELSHSLIAAVIDAVAIPVSIKVRISINDKHGSSLKKVTILEFLQRMKDLPIAAIMVHGRSFEAPYEGGIDIDMIKEVKKIFTSGPVLANGGLQHIEDAATVLAETGADGLGLARSVLGKPWVIKQVKDYLKKGRYEQLDWEAVKQLMVDHATLHEQYRGRKPFYAIRHHLAQYAKGHPHAAELRTQLVQVNSTDDVKSVLSNF